MDSPKRVEGDERGRSTVRLKRDVEILEIRMDTIVDILKGCIWDPEHPPVVNPPGYEDEDDGDIGEPTSRGGPC